jgi:hypothetical protein
LSSEHLAICILGGGGGKSGGLATTVKSNGSDRYEALTECNHFQGCEDFVMNSGYLLRRKRWVEGFNPLGFLRPKSTSAMDNGQWKLDNES